MAEDEKRLENFGIDEEMDMLEYTLWLDTGEGREFLKNNLFPEGRGEEDYSPLYLSKLMFIMLYAKSHED